MKCHNFIGVKKTKFLVKLYCIGPNIIIDFGLWIKKVGFSPIDILLKCACVV